MHLDISQDSANERLKEQTRHGSLFSIVANNTTLEYKAEVLGI